MAVATGRTLEEIMDLSPAQAKAMEAAAARLRAADALLALHVATAANAAPWDKGKAARALCGDLQKRANA